MIKSDLIENAGGRVARIRFDRVEKKNAITPEMYSMLGAALRAAEENREVRAILIHGTRDCFTAGNDLKDFLERSPGGGPTASFQFIAALPKVAKPLIAAVGGPAVGVGGGERLQHRAVHVLRERVLLVRPRDFDARDAIPEFRQDHVGSL